MQEVRMDRISWVEYQSRLAAKPVLFLPCGALEQHGPHLPLGVDAMLASDIARRVASALGGLVAPPLNYGYKSQARCGGGQTFPGTTSLDGEHLIGVVRDIIREFVRHGVERLVLVDGHYENQWFLTEAIETAVRELAPPVESGAHRVLGILSAVGTGRGVRQRFPGVRAGTRRTDRNFHDAGAAPGAGGDGQAAGRWAG